MKLGLWARFRRLVPGVCRKRILSSQGSAAWAAPAVLGEAGCAICARGGCSLERSPKTALGDMTNNSLAARRMFSGVLQDVTAKNLETHGSLKQRQQGPKE